MDEEKDTKERTGILGFIANLLEAILGVDRDKEERDKQDREIENAYFVKHGTFEGAQNAGLDPKGNLIYREDFTPPPLVGAPPPLVGVQTSNATQVTPPVFKQPAVRRQQAINL